MVYNEPYVSYDKTVKYRGYGAVEAAKLGAVAALVGFFSFEKYSVYSILKNLYFFH